jgi:hypothetical protein
VLQVKKKTLAQTKAANKKETTYKTPVDPSTLPTSRQYLFSTQLFSPNMTLGEKEKGPVSKIGSALWSKNTQTDVAAIDNALQVSEQRARQKKAMGMKGHFWKKFVWKVTGFDKEGNKKGDPLPKYLEKRVYYDDLFRQASSQGGNPQDNPRKRAKDKLIQDFPDTWELSQQDSRKPTQKRDKKLKGTPIPIKKAYGTEDMDEMKLPADDGVEKTTKGQDYPKNFCFPYAERVPWNESNTATWRYVNRLKNGYSDALEYNIQPLDPDIPHQLGFQIHLLPKQDMSFLVISEGNKQAMKTFAREAEAINLCLDEYQLKSYLLGNLSKDKSSLEPLASEDMLLEKIGGLSQFGKTKLELCVSDALARIEHEMETVGIGKATRMDEWTSWDLIPDIWQAWCLGRAQFIRKKEAPPTSEKAVVNSAKKNKGTHVGSWERAISTAEVTEERSEAEALKNKHYISLIGDIPPCEKSTRSFYLMDQWGCQGLKEAKHRRGSKYEKMSLYEVEKTGEAVYHSKYMNLVQGVAVGNVHYLVAKALQKVLQLEKPFEYTGGSGIVKTGKSIADEEVESLIDYCVECSGQENHVDDLNALKSDMLAKFYKGELEEEDVYETLNHGYLIDIPLTETGRVTKFLVPGKPGSKELIQKTIYTPFGSATVRSMILLHGGHGGECGNTLWHGSIFPKGVLAQVEEDKLGYLRLLPEYHQEFKEYKLVWKNEEANLPKHWMQNVSRQEKAMSSRYATDLYKCYKAPDSQMWIARWLLSPNEKIRELHEMHHIDEENEKGETEGKNKKRTEAAQASSPVLEKKKLKFTYGINGNGSTFVATGVDTLRGDSVEPAKENNSSAIPVSVGTPASTEAGYTPPGCLDNKDLMEADI